MNVIISAAILFLVSGNRLNALECQHRDCVSVWVYVEQSVHPQMREIFKRNQTQYGSPKGPEKYQSYHFMAKWKVIEQEGDLQPRLYLWRFFP